MTTLALPATTSPTTRDFSSVSAYAGAMELHYFRGEGARHTTETIPLSPPQTDVGNNRNEMPSALGRFFAQGDFSHGAGQGYFHYQSSDPAKYLYSEGFDISELGLLRHHNAMILNAMGALAAGSTGRSVQSQGKLFVADGATVKVFDPVTGTPTTEDPYAGEALLTTAVQDLTSEGDRVFAALGNNGIHVRSATGVWTHYNDAAVHRISFLKDRIMAASSRDIYEVTAGGATPISKLTLKEGWRFTDIGENGPFIYAPAITETAGDVGMCKVHHFGLDDSLNLVPKGSTWMPNNELCFSVKGYLGTIYLGCGRVNASGGKDALIYKATPDADGFLAYDLISDSEGAGTRDLSVKAMGTKGRNVIFGWTLGTDAPYGAREGIAIYDPALDSFSHHLASVASPPTPRIALSTNVFKGRIVIVTLGGVYYEDTTTKVAQASLISSIANWNNPGVKNWDESSLATRSLPNTASVDLQYTLDHPEEGNWLLADSHTVPGATKATFRHANTESSRFTVKLVSNATTSRVTAPEIETFSVRSNPTVENTEYRLIRTVHFVGTISKGHRGAVRSYNPLSERDALRALENTWFDLYEPDASYNVRLTQTQEIASNTAHPTTGGDPRRFEFVMVCVFEGRKEATGDVIGGGYSGGF